MHPETPLNTERAFYFSKPWKNCSKKFQTLETFLPMFGKLEEVGEEVVAHALEVFHFLGGFEQVGE